MGVPDLFTWIRKKYPKCVEKALECSPIFQNDSLDFTQIEYETDNPNGMEIDNFYLDMNGLLHPCCHPTDSSAPKSEEEMLETVDLVLLRLIHMIRPRHLLFIAIDGVAPRAKLNQQRSRRFRRALEIQAENSESKRGENGWDSNVITPGTEFMIKVSDHISEFLRDKILNQEKFSNLNVIFSDWRQPGEGEHKIVQFIRNIRHYPNYDHNITHCVYGLDADLILLSLGLHESRIIILRESITTNAITDKKLNRINPILTKPFMLLYISTLREYMERVEFPKDHWSCLGFKYNLESFIDDFILLCILVGNDFLPGLPILKIKENGLELLMYYYKQLLPINKKYLIDDCIINWDFLNYIFYLLGKNEQDILICRDTYNNNNNNNNEQSYPIKRKYNEFNQSSDYKRKTRVLLPSPLPVLNYPTTSNQGKFNDDDNYNSSAILRKLLYPSLDSEKKEIKTSCPDKEKSEDKLSESIDINDDANPEKINDIIEIDDHIDDINIPIPKTVILPPAVVDFSRKDYKEQYYDLKFQQYNLQNICEQYIKGVQFIILYYLKAIPSWSWFYPYLYSPFPSDLVNISDDVNFDFDLSEPYDPLLQLLAVLPALSSKALPDCLGRLMTDRESPIADFYSMDLKLDPNGEHFPWLYVTLLPPYDEEKLKAAYNECLPLFSTNDIERNKTLNTLLLISKESKSYKVINELILMKSDVICSFHSWGCKIILDECILDDPKTWIFRMTLVDDTYVSHNDHELLPNIKPVPNVLHMNDLFPIKVKCHGIDLSRYMIPINILEDISRSPKCSNKHVDNDAIEMSNSPNIDVNEDDSTTKNISINHPDEDHNSGGDYNDTCNNNECDTNNNEENNDITDSNRYNLEDDAKSIDSDEPIDQIRDIRGDH